MKKNVGVLALVLLLAACAERTDKVAAAIPIQECRRVALIDESTGANIIGAEDMVLDPQQRRLFVSAYDRRAVLSAARKKAFSLPEGGIYEVDLRALSDRSQSSAPARPFADAFTVGGGLRPHGIDFDAERNELVFVNRGYQRINNHWHMTPRLERIGASGETFVGASPQVPCGANGVVSVDGATLVSFDRGGCEGFGAFVEQAFNLPRSGVASDRGERYFDRARFANGVVQLGGGVLALAATRDRAVFLLASDEDFRKVGRISVPGGPDNLTVSQDGALLAAVHPSLLKLAFHQRLGARYAPSRVVRIDPESGDVSVLIDDPAGGVFSGATVAVDIGDAIVVGSATDEGVLLCPADAIAPPGE